MIMWILLIAGVVLLDQLTKILVWSLMQVGESVDIIPNVFRFTYVQNEGAAFGMLAEHRWIFMVLSVIGIAAMLIYLWRFRPNSRLACTALSLIIGGGIGNMIDRVVLGYVVDFLDFCAFPNLWMWVFNVADSCVCIGAGLLILWLVLDMVREIRKEKKRKTEEQA